MESVSSSTEKRDFLQSSTSETAMKEEPDNQRITMRKGDRRKIRRVRSPTPSNQQKRILKSQLQHNSQLLQQKIAKPRTTTSKIATAAA